MSSRPAPPAPSLGDAYDPPSTFPLGGVIVDVPPLEGSAQGSLIVRLPPRSSSLPPWSTDQMAAFIQSSLTSFPWIPTSALDALFGFEVPERKFAWAEEEARTSASATRLHTSVSPSSLARRSSSSVTTLASAGSSTGAHSYTLWDKAVLLDMAMAGGGSGTGTGTNLFELYVDPSLNDSFVRPLEQSLHDAFDRPFVDSLPLISHSANLRRHLTEILSRPYDGDESSSGQPIVRQLLDGANRLMSAFATMMDVTDHVSEWNGIAPGEWVRPNFVSRDCVVEVKMNIAAVLKGMKNFANSSSRSPACATFVGGVADDGKPLLSGQLCISRPGAERNEPDVMDQVATSLVTQVRRPSPFKHHTRSRSLHPAHLFRQSYKCARTASATGSSSTGTKPS